MKLTENKLRKIVREEISSLLEARVEFDADKMRSLLKKDRFLQHALRDVSKSKSEEERLEVLFNTYVFGDSNLERQYMKEGRLSEAAPTADPEKMKKLAKKDAMIKFAYDDMKGRNIPEDKLWQIVYNTYVLGDSAMERAYKRA